jgi:hypothetical protein
MEHSLHLGARHFVEEVAPMSAHAVLKKVQGVDVRSDDEYIEEELGTLDDEDNDGGSFTVGDTVGKALALVTQIRKSPQARAFFRRCCQEVGAPPLELLTWIRTRWASLFTFLDRMILLREVR